MGSRVRTVGGVGMMMALPVMALGAGCAEERSYGRADVTPPQATYSQTAGGYDQTYGVPYGQAPYSQSQSGQPQYGQAPYSQRPYCKPARTSARVGQPSDVVNPGPVVVTGGVIQPGTRLIVQLDETISTDTSNEGQPYTARVVTPVIDQTGRVLIPQGTEVDGTIAKLEESFGDEPATVSLSVDEIRVCGLAQPFAATIVGTDVQAARTGVRPLPIGGGGAMAGAILGPATSGALVGGALGAGVGTSISLGAQNQPGKLPAGTALAVQIQRPINVAQLSGGARRF